MIQKTFDEEFTPQSPWLDLVNSEQWDGFGRSTDHLRDPRWVTRYLKYWEADTKRLARKSALSQLAGLRRLLRRLTEKLASGKTLAKQDVNALNAFLNVPSYMRVVSAGKRISTELRPARRSWSWIKARVAASFVDSMQREPERIKICGNDQCRWAYVDATKGNIRRWCRDRRCGNRARVRRARARQRRRGKYRSP